MTKGEELGAAINGIRCFLSDLGQLLATGDALMAEKSWEAVGGAGCTEGTSASVYQGRQWMPRATFRRYRNTSAFPPVLGMLSVLLERESIPLGEPVVAGSFFVFPEDTPENKVWVGAWNALGRLAKHADGRVADRGS